MAQPDYQNISACLTGLAREFVLLPNAPLAITNQALIDSINELRNELRLTAAETNTHIDEQIAETKRYIAERIATTNRHIESLRTDITP
ncbi:hypothetical protein MMC29_007671 [Sticta canariensis]|nr:hypothetical protein [Sticta canariensis]